MSFQGRLSVFFAVSAQILLGGAPPVEKTHPGQLLNLPIYFERNVGQADAGVSFLSRGHFHNISIVGNRVVFAFGDGANVAEMELLGGSRSASVLGVEKLAGVSNYYRGSDSRAWMTGIEQFGRVQLKSLYPGIDLEIYGKGGLLEYDFVLAPGADPRQVRLRFRGTKAARIDAAGNLVLEMPQGAVRQHRPIIYQQEGATRHSVAGGYVREQDGTVRIALGRYDKRKPLVIDPILDYSGFLNASGLGRVRGAADSSRGAIFAGTTFNASLNSAINPAQAVFRGGSDVFVLKLNPAGDGVVYATFFGGSGDETIGDVAASPLAAATIVGGTTSVNIPNMNGFQTTNAGGQDAFILRLNTFGALVYASYLGGSLHDFAYAVAVDSSGAAYLTGQTGSANFPVSGGAPQGARSGTLDAFATKVSADGASRLYSTYLGGSSAEVAYGIAVDASGAAFLAGETSSTDFPGASLGPQKTYQGGSDAFAVKLNPSGTAVSWGTYIGGTARDWATGIDVDPSGNAVVAGNTYSTDLPVQSAQQGAKSASRDAFVARINSSGSAFAYLTYLGGSGLDTALDVAVDLAGAAVIGGATTSSNFLTSNSLQSAKKGLANVIHRSNNNGDTWQVSDGGLAGISLVGAIVADPTNASLRYALNECMVYASSDAGLTWTARSNPSCTARALIHHPSLPNILYAAGEEGIVKSTNGGASWTSIMSGLPAPGTAGPFGGLAVDPDAGAEASTVLYATYRSGGVYRSANGGASWTAANGNLTGSARIAGPVIVTPGTSGNNAFIATAFGLWRTTNAGTSWTQFVTAQSDGFTGVFSFAGPRLYYNFLCNVYAISNVTSGTPAAALRSTVAQGCLYSDAFLAVPGGPNDTLYYGSFEAGLLRSPDSGFTWTQQGFNGDSVSALSLAGGVLLAGTVVPADAFATKLTAAGSVEYSTYLGGVGDDEVSAVGVTSTGVAFLFGSGTTGFPITPGAAYPTRNSGNFLAKVSPTTPACDFTVTPSAFSMLAQTGLERIKISGPSGCVWSATTGSGAITLRAPTSGTGSGLLEFDLAPNGASTRTGTIQVAGKTVTVRQAGSSCNYVLSSSSKSFGAAGGVTTIDLTVGSTCPWSIDSSGGWVSFTPSIAAPYTGSATITIQAAPNPSTTARSFTVFVGNSSLTVNQAGSGAEQTAITPAFVFRDTNKGIRLIRAGSNTQYPVGGVFDGDPSAAQGPNGDVFVAARADTYNSLYVNRWTRATASWGDWIGLGTPFQGNPSLVYHPSGRLYIAVRDIWYAYWIVSYNLTTGAAQYYFRGGVFNTDPVLKVSPDNSLTLLGKDFWDGLWINQFTEGSGFYNERFIGGQVGGTPSPTFGADGALYIGIRDIWANTWMARYIAGQPAASWYIGRGIVSADPVTIASGGVIYMTVLNNFSSVFYRAFTEGAVDGWQTWTFVGGDLNRISTSGSAGELYVSGSGPSGIWWWKLNGNLWTYLGPSALVGSGVSAVPR